MFIYYLCRFLADSEEFLILSAGRFWLKMCLQADQKFSLWNLENFNFYKNCLQTQKICLRPMVARSPLFPALYIRYALWWKSCQITNFWPKTTNLTSKMIYIQFHDDLNRFEDDSIYIHRYIHTYIRYALWWKIMSNRHFLA